jgi:hypothetical protein
VLEEVISDDEVETGVRDRRELLAVVEYVDRD